MEYLDSKVINRTDKTLSVKLKKTKEKGVSLFATKIINKGETIALKNKSLFNSNIRIAYKLCLLFRNL